ncbi:MAG: hypothetical protein RI893_1129 [Pseudomonadota bacterium]|jgi:hypothetical protein
MKHKIEDDKFVNYFLILIMILGFVVMLLI